MKSFIQNIIFLSIFGAFIFFEPLRYWTFEIVGSIILDVLVIAGMLFVGAVVFGTLVHWNTIMAALGKIIREIVHMIAMR